MPTISEEDRKRRFGADLDDREHATTASGVQHCFSHYVVDGGRALKRRGRIVTMDDLLEGENWLHMAYGFFKETYQELSHDSSQSGFCVNVDGQVAGVKNTSEKTSVTIAHGGASDYVPLPRYQLRILTEGDRIKVAHSGGFFGSSDVVLTYHQKVAGSKTKAEWEHVGGKEQPPPCCNFCNAVGGHLRTCNACKSVRYCNSHCQKSDRKDHKAECKKKEKELA